MLDWFAIEVADHAGNDSHYIAQDIEQFASIVTSNHDMWSLKAITCDAAMLAQMRIDEVFG
jgi:F420-dependent methylenetetrahydromethanopterin dehydrogenase